MSNLTVTGEIVLKEGRKKLLLSNNQYFVHGIQKMKPGKVRVTIERKVARRSNNQNAYFHGPVMDLLKETTGEVNPRVLKEYLKAQFGVREKVTINGKTVEILKSTADYTKAEFVEFLMKISDFFQIVLPNPEDAGYISPNAPIRG